MDKRSDVSRDFLGIVFSGVGLWEEAPRKLKGYSCDIRGISYQDLWLS